MKHWLRFVLIVAIALGLWGIVQPAQPQTSGSVASSSMAIAANGADITQPILNDARYSYTDTSSNTRITSSSGQRIIEIDLTDPFGRVVGCDGDLLATVDGFSVGVFEPASNDPDDPELGRLVPLTRTEIPDIPNNGIPEGLPPNRTNINPFPLSNQTEGRYNFLLDPDRGQVQAGSAYILAVTPPDDSGLAERRVRIELEAEAADGRIPYIATALDGQPIGADGQAVVRGTLRASDVQTVGLVLAFRNLAIAECEAQPLQVSKIGDRVTAVPGDIVAYRVTVENQTAVDVDDVVVTDTLPEGFALLSESVQATVQERDVELNVEQSGQFVALRSPVAIPAGGTLIVAYAAELTPDAVRGSGENAAAASGRRADTGQVVSGGIAIHRVRVRGGIVSDSGTILGRVFVDKNFDGEQQPNEPGVPNAVVFLDDGTRVTTDPDGLFSLTNILPGYRTGVLDLTSLPGYTLAPNRKFIERNSQSRLVHLSPGGMVRLNFAVTPSFNESDGGEGDEPEGDESEGNESASESNESDGRIQEGPL